ncbi:phasin family protein [Pikeienuella piscinae]|uniref:Phasin family protein n=1 Tax=Pikeienuella piscinae TaxID=2748098 RepID=A0A7L5BX72_9RHOB|nr:phasin family protein [Pikeienuella piscinae]QIE55438.1 phasin family protein [Pikeienuella piscinae]
MFSAGANPFDPTKFTEMFTSMDPTKFFDFSSMKGFDKSALLAAQQKNMEALVTAQKAAAAGYQDLFEKQVAIFQETMKAAQAQIAELAKAEPGADAASKQAELTSKAFERAVANAQELADAAGRANAEAYEIVRARIDASVEELKGSTR